jgi:hypothetical protein
MRSLIRKKNKPAPRPDNSERKLPKAADRSNAQCCAKTSRTVAGCHD